MTSSSKPVVKPPPIPDLCQRCGIHPPTLLAEWQRAEPVTITVKNPTTGQTTTRLSEGSWQREHLCDGCGGASITSDDPPRRMTRLVPDRLVQVLSSAAQKMEGNGTGYKAAT